MTSKVFIAAEFAVALCGLAAVVLVLATWRGGTIQIAVLVGALLVGAAGLVAAIAGLRLRRQQVATPAS